MALRSILSHPLTRGLDLDSPQTTSVRRRLIDQKSFLRQFYQDCYRLVAHSMATGIEGPILELGSGGGFIKEHLPDCITSEIQQVSAVDIVLDGQQLPFSDIALAGIVMLDVFHHVPRATSLLQEATRCIRPGGVAYRSFLPGAWYGICRRLERLLNPWHRHWAMFAVVVLKRKTPEDLQV